MVWWNPHSLPSFWIILSLPTSIAAGRIWILKIFCFQEIEMYNSGLLFSVHIFSFIKFWKINPPFIKVKLTLSSENCSIYYSQGFTASSSLKFQHCSWVCRDLRDASVVYSRLILKFQARLWPYQRKHTHLCLLPAWPLPGRRCWPGLLCPTQWAPGRRCWGLPAAGRSMWRCGSTAGSQCVVAPLSCAWLTCCCQGGGTWVGGHIKFTMLSDRFLAAGAHMGHAWWVHVGYTSRTTIKLLFQQRMNY